MITNFTCREELTYSIFFEESDNSTDLKQVWNKYMVGNPERLMSANELETLLKSHFKDNVAVTLSELWFMYRYYSVVGCELHPSKAILDEQLIGIASQKNSEYFEVINSVAGAIFESGHWNKIFEYNIFALQVEEKCENQQIPNITYETVSYIFFALMILIGLSVLVATVEYFWALKRSKVIHS